MVRKFGTVVWALKNLRSSYKFIVYICPLKKRLVRYSIEILTCAVAIRLNNRCERCASFSFHPKIPLTYILYSLCHCANLCASVLFYTRLCCDRCEKDLRTVIIFIPVVTANRYIYEIATILFKVLPDRSWSCNYL